MVKTATLKKKLTPKGGPVVEQALYEFDPPHEGHRFVVVSASNVPMSGPETYLFAANEAGEVQEWIELSGSTRGTLSHEDVLTHLGYRRVVPMYPPVKREGTW